MTLAAIDIGSNALRLLIAEAPPAPEEGATYTRLNFLRIPLRLGSDVFDSGVISEAKTADFVDAIKAFSLLMHLHRVSHYRACATSAMRDAKNGAQVIESARAATGIAIEVISGDEEATLLYEALTALAPDKGMPCLFIDVGGGSTEITLFARHEMRFRHSFNIGAVRMIQGAVTDAEMDRLKDFVKTYSGDLGGIRAVGTGGNINKLHDLAGIKRSEPLSLDRLETFLAKMEKLSVEQRMQRFQLRQDRADVIVPALKIYCSIMRWGHIDEIYVPKIGLADGLIRSLYRQYGP